VPCRDFSEREKVTLLYGPYTPPRLQLGERAFCLVRDRLIVVTDWSEARLSWPLGHALEQGGGRGILAVSRHSRLCLPLIL
jgi:hypothetical protein